MAVTANFSRNRVEFPENKKVVLSIQHCLGNETLLKRAISGCLNYVSRIRLGPGGRVQLETSKRSYI